LGPAEDSDALLNLFDFFLYFSFFVCAVFFPEIEKYWVCNINNFVAGTVKPPPRPLDFRKEIFLSWPGLPDGLFSNQKAKFGKILEGLARYYVGIFYGHLVHFAVFCYIFLTFGIVCFIIWYIFPVLVFCTKKNLATLILA
jgi:hypothetical protein